MKSVCIFCGADKVKPLDLCVACGEKPHKKTDCLHSIIMSFDDKDYQFNILDKDTYDDYSNKIKNNYPLEFDKEIMKKVETIYREVASVTNWDLFIYLAKFFWPIIPIAIITIVYFFIW